MKEIVFELVNKDLFNKIDYRTQFGLLDGELIVNINGPKVRVKFNNSKVSVSDMIMYTLNKVQVSDINVKDTDIEDVIKKMYQQQGGVIDA